MPTFLTRRAISIGEAMLELAPVGDGLCRQGYAGDNFNTIWHMALLLGFGVASGFVTRVGRDSLRPPPRAASPATRPRSRLRSTARASSISPASRL